MGSAALLLGGLLGTVAVVSAVLLLIMRRRATTVIHFIALVALLSGGALIALSNAGTVSALLITLAAYDTPGLTEADRPRILMAGIVESLFNLSFGLIFGLPATIAGYFTIKRLSSEAGRPRQQGG